MGKASKWIRNFLLGKKEYRKRSDTSFSLEFRSNNMESQPCTPKVKRKWSFRKSAGKNGSHKLSKSLDSIEAGKLQTQATAEPVASRNRARALVVIRGRIENIAATKIQAAFRSYLARRALHALRGLVKLQALVRGHIVRKQTASTLKRMHALMSIQVRARFQRIQMAEETQHVTRNQSSVDDSVVHDKRKAVNLDSKSARTERIDASLYSDQLSISKRIQYEEFYLSTAENSPRSYSVTTRPNPTTVSLAHQQSLLRNYMINTESSRAKVRSHSEPKQRPKWNARQKNKQAEVEDGMCVSPDDPFVKRSSPRCKFDVLDNHDPWLYKLYKTGRSSRNNKCDSVRDSIKHYEPFADYEPNFNLY